MLTWIWAAPLHVLLIELLYTQQKSYRFWKQYNVISKIMVIKFENEFFFQKIQQK